MITIRIGLGDGFYILDPQEDITPLESIHLSIFLIAVTKHTGMRLEDRVKYIHKHNLWRHFKKENKNGQDLS